MIKFFVFFTIVLPFSCFAQIVISGRVINRADTKPVPDASVFLSNATIGCKTDDKGFFTLNNVKPGKYELVVSIIGFETYGQTVTVENNNINLANITVLPKTIALKEISIKYHADPNREKYYEWFKDEFLGTSEAAQACKILNPDVLDFAYDKDAGKLTASSYDFLLIENDALGYRIKYLIKNFSFENKDGDEKKVYYEGPVLFEEMKGSPSEERRWQRNREQVYENSPAHFLRAAVNNRLYQEGFRVQKTVDTPREIEKTITLKAQDFIKMTDRPGIYMLRGDSSGMFVAYSKNHRYYIKNAFEYLANRGNDETTFLKFNAPEVFFDSNGVITNPYGVMYYGVWGRNRVAGLLPVDYQPPPNTSTSGDEVGGLISGKLEAYDTTHVIEKAYLHLDKPYYAAGDTVYFKAYVTAGDQHKLSEISGVLHVDLINIKDKIDQSIKLQLDRGLAWGDFALPDSLPGGNYRIRAYTRWMRNDGENDFFDKVIPVASLKAVSISAITGKQPKQSHDIKPDLQFFPEGGSLVTGIRSKVAFKAIGPDGTGIGVKGILTDNTGKELTSFSSAHLGMGYFYLDPEESKTYTARLVYADGRRDTVRLPKPETSGIILSVNNDAIPDAAVRIAANDAWYRENKNKDYILFIYSGGIATRVTFKLDSPVITMDILKRHLHTGVATVTLFSLRGEPLCERLMFVQNYEQLRLHLSGNKQEYAEREKVHIKLEAINRAGNPAAGHFSVSVTDENKVPQDENNECTILSYLLLTSDLKGYVEQPNYYFADSSKTAADNLDILMLTQGYRRFGWKQIFDTTKQVIACQPEQGIEISGQVKSLFNKPTKNGTVTLIPVNGGPVLSSPTDENGMFRFSNLMFTDTAHFVLSAINSKNKNSTKITYFSERRGEPAVELNRQQQVQQVADTIIATYADNEELRQREVLNYGKGKGIMLNEVKVHEKKPDDQYPTQSLAGAGFADQVMHTDEIERIEGPLVTSLDGRLRGVTFVGPMPHKTAFLTLNLMAGMPGNASKSMLLIIDGAEADPDAINYLNTADVETVEVLRYASASIYGMEGGGGVLVVTTKQSLGLSATDVAAIGVLPIAPMGFYKAREFYSPKYDNPALITKQRDFRSTIYWNPEIKTDLAGNTSFDYYNADSAGTYKVTVEGIDKDGNIGRQVYRYKVR